jgi:hypothetical protein
MITIIIGILTGIIIAIVSNYRNGWTDFIDYFLDSILYGLLGFAFGGLIAFSLPMSTETKSESYNIESLSDNSSISGNFFIGCGSINGVMKYSFYYSNKDYYKLMQIDCEDAIVKYSEDSPRIIIYEDEPLPKLINLFALDADFNRHYEICVPKGTIKNNYTLDAQ